MFSIGSRYLIGESDGLLLLLLLFDDENEMGWHSRGDGPFLLHLDGGGLEFSAVSDVVVKGSCQGSREQVGEGCTFILFFRW